MNHYFKIAERNSTPYRETLAGVVTFMTMAYILCVQPAIMSGQMFGMDTGMNIGALITATCIAAAFGSILMGFWANYPIALAPGMGQNFFVVLTLMPFCAVMLGSQVGADSVWQLALGVVFVSGVFFAILSFLNIRKLLIDAISPSLRSGISAGIGLFIALLGLQYAELIITKNGNYVLGSFTATPGPLVFCVGLIAAAVLFSLRFRGALLFAIIISAFVAAWFGQITLGIPFGTPASPMPVVAKIDLWGVVEHFAQLLPMIIILLVMDVFDTLGTTVAVGTRAGLIQDDKFPNVERVFAADATATVFGAVCGHSTVTAYIESTAGVESGGRTGLTAIVTGILFLLAMFFAPFIEMIGSYQPITASALVIVGAFMMQSAAKIDWDDATESIPAFLIMIGIPFSYNISDGLILGLMIYPVIKLLSGKGLSINWLLYPLSILLVLYAVLLK